MPLVFGCKKNFIKFAKNRVQPLDKPHKQIYNVGEIREEVKILRMRKLNTGGEWYEIDVARFQRVRSQIRSLHQNLVRNVQRTKQRTMQSALSFFCPFSPLFSKFQSEKHNFEYNFINAID